MTKGNSTYEGLALPTHGESEITQTTAATDIFTITGATSQSGDFIVCVNSTGGENIVLSSSGKITSVVGIAATTADLSGLVKATVASTLITSGFRVLVTSTGAIAAGASLVNGFVVTPSSKANMTAAFAYNINTEFTDGTSVGVCRYLLAVQGSKPPTYLLGVGATTPGVGTATDGGFVEAGLKLLTALGTGVNMVGLKVQFGDSTFYIPCIPTSTLV